MKKFESSLNTDKKSKKHVVLTFFKKHKILFFLMLFFAIGTNTYAWFIYNSIVSVDITGHVKAWKISLGEEGNAWDVELNDLYPGMTKVEETQTLSNGGEVSANVTLNVLEYTLFGKTYTSLVTEEEAKEKGLDVVVMTPDELYNTLNTYYPFEITLSSDASSVKAGEDITIKVECEWDYEGTRTDPEKTMTSNEWDTYWGNQASAFYDSVGGDTSKNVALSIKVEIKAEQN